MISVLRGMDYKHIGTGVMAYVLLTGCAAISPANRLGANHSPSTWAASTEAQAGIDQNWLKKIGGKELEELVDTALSKNEDIKAAAARVDRAASEANIAGAGRIPSLSVGGNAQRIQQAFIGFPFAGGPTSNLTDQFGVNLNAAWELDVWGRVKAGQESSLANAEARAYELKAAQVSLAAQVAKIWLALAEANQQLALAQSAVDSSEILASAVRERYERALTSAGGSASQVRLTRSELASRQAALAQRKQEREHVLRQLEILLGNYPSGSLQAASQLPVFPRKTPAGLPSELLQRRPDILAAERAYAASGRLVKERKLARFPSLSLTASGGTNTESLRDILLSDSIVWSLGGSLTQPIFEAGRLQGEIDRASATEREQASQLRKVVLDAFGEVEQSLTAESFLAEREGASSQAAKLAEEAAERAMDEYNAGTGDVLTLIDATQQKISAASQYQAIRRMRLENRVDLHLALGGDFKATK